MKRFKNFALAMSFVAVSTVLSACTGGSSADATSPTIEVSAAGTNTPDLSEITNEHIEKHNAYIDLVNFTSSWLDGMMVGYFSRFGWDDEPDTTQEWAGFGGVDMIAMHGSRTDLSRHLAVSGPSFGLADEKMILLCDAYDNIVNLYFDQMHRYFEDSEYLADNFEGFREMHLRMNMYYDQMWDALEDFYEAFQPILIAFQGADLPIFAEQGLWIRYHTLSLVLVGMEMSNLFHARAGQGIDFLDVDLNEYQPLYDRFIAHLEALTDIYSDQEQLAFERFSSVQSNHLSLFFSTAQQMEVAATDTLNMIIAGTEDIENELTGRVTTGGRNMPMGRFDTRLDQLIGRYNQTIN